MKLKQNTYCIEQKTISNNCYCIFLDPTLNDCIEGEIRLANNSAENKGRVEICVDGFWGTMCPNNSFTLNANIICKQLGFSEYGNSILYNVMT